MIKPENLARSRIRVPCGALGVTVLFVRLKRGVILILSQTISGQNLQFRSDGRRCHCTGNVTANHAKYTNRNLRPSATDPQNSPWPLCLCGENNHGDPARQSCNRSKSTTDEHG
jgi:hypothetical protein